MSAVCVRVVLFCSSGPESAAAPANRQQRKQSVFATPNGESPRAQRRIGRVKTEPSHGRLPNKERLRLQRRIGRVKSRPKRRIREGSVCNAESGESSQVNSKGRAAIHAIHVLHPEKEHYVLIRSALRSAKRIVQLWWAATIFERWRSKKS